VKSRFYSREVKVGDLTLGGKHPVLIQSMTNTSTSDVQSTVNQIHRLVNHGCDIVRVAVPTLTDAKSIKQINIELQNIGLHLPIVADVHYSTKVAELAARYADKVRINPGNYLFDRTKEHYSQEDFEIAHRQIAENIQPLLVICKKHQTALRIGVNRGSLSKRILYRYGNTAKGMVASALEFIDILIESGFDQFTLSLKASDVRIMQEANVMLVKEMIRRDTFFPLHLGVTEAGAGNDARIKSSAGIGALLGLGIGDTIRVSLTEEPEEEIPVAKLLLPFASRKGVVFEDLKHLHFHPEKIDDEVTMLTQQSKPLVVGNSNNEADLIMSDNGLIASETGLTVSSKKLRISKIESNEKNFIDFLVNSSVKFACDFLKKSVQAIYLMNPSFSSSTLTELSLDILQGMGLRYTKIEFVACPSCGRTLFNIAEHLKRVQQLTSQYKNLKIAVMGCVINGPGEMAGADYGYVGSSKGKVTLYKAGKIVKRDISEETAASQLQEIIENDLIKK
jgi:(E)-4-hydroxy-3-methylbut-2-enyl-diphosphate synthase